jgi:LDH2 family malate/lactate/ureidoglycolate dehydrogenase
MDCPASIPHTALRGFAEAILTGAGVPPARARLAAESLVSANLRGVDSHGIHLLPYYVKQLRAGNIDAAADGMVISESGACLLFDGQKGLGQHVSATCCDHAVRLAGDHGLGLALARNSNHFGAAAFWAQRISAAGMIGVVLCNSSPSVPPWQGREGRIGTNPICVSVPGSGQGSWLLDMATTTVAMNRIVRAATTCETAIPLGWAMDSEGIPTTDPQVALRGLLMPLGGYKGSGLGLMVEILCGVLAGGALSTAVGGLHIYERPMRTSQFFLAIDVERFLPPGEFRSRMEYLVTTIKAVTPAAGYSEVLVAGEPETRNEARRLSKGVPIELPLLERLNALAREFRIPCL